MSAWNTDQISGHRPTGPGRRDELRSREITTYELARKGAQVVLAVRDTIKGEGSVQWIRSAFPGVLVDVRELDLSSLESARAFAIGVVGESPTLDLLVNNAGIMMTPTSRTADGYELQLGTTHQGDRVLATAPAFPP